MNRKKYERIIIGKGKLARRTETKQYIFMFKEKLRRKERNACSTTNNRTVEQVTDGNPIWQCQSSLFAAFFERLYTKEPFVVTR